MDNSIKNLETDLKNSARTTHDRDDKFEECMGSFAKDAREQCSILQVTLSGEIHSFDNLSHKRVFFARCNAWN